MTSNRKRKPLFLKHIQKQMKMLCFFSMTSFRIKELSQKCRVSGLIMVHTAHTKDIEFFTF